MADKGSTFYNRSVKWRLQNHYIKINSIHNEGISAVSERYDFSIQKCAYR